ncbi:MAG: hypothetical protein K2M76_00555 [Muribaculaceae bacterium]|nr:hypothetical protein [Muribaculaceae bacterium]
MDNLRYILAVVAVMVASVSIKAAEPVNGVKPESHTIYASIGYSGMLTPMPKNFDSGSFSSGMDWMIGYDRMYHYHKVGYGVLYSGSMATGKYLGLKQHLYINYIAPQFVGSTYKAGSRAKFNLHFGFGLMSATESMPGGVVYTQTVHGFSKTHFGIGFNFAFGTEYKLNDTMGLIVNVADVFGFIGYDFDINGVKCIDPQTHFLSRASLDIGQKFNF